MGLKLIFLIVSRAVSLFGLSRRESWWKDAEILMLRHQLAVTQREPPRAYSRLAWPDRAWLALLAGTLPVERLAAMRLIVTPGIILRWHRDIVRRQWGRRSRQGRSGRPATHRKVRSVVLRLARESESWGYRRIHPQVRPGETACIPSPAADRGADGWVLVPMSPEQPPSTVVERPVSGPRSEEEMMPADVLAASTMRFATDPDQARSAPAVTASLVNGHARLSAGPFNWDADLPTAIGGENLAPSPTAYLLGALAGCAVAFIHDTLAPQLGPRLDDVSAVARCTTDARGLLGMEGAVPDLGEVAVEIHVVSSEPADRLRPLFEVWQQGCPVYLALVDPVAVQATFTTETATA